MKQEKPRVMVGTNMLATFVTFVKTFEKVTKFNWMGTNAIQSLHGRRLKTKE